MKIFIYFHRCIICQMNLINIMDLEFFLKQFPEKKNIFPPSLSEMTPDLTEVQLFGDTASQTSDDIFKRCDLYFHVKLKMSCSTSEAPLVGPPGGNCVPTTCTTCSLDGMLSRPRVYRILFGLCALGTS